MTITIGTIIGNNVKIEKGAFIGPLTQIEDEVVIGSKVYIDPKVLIYARQRVQAGLFIMKNENGSLYAKKLSEITKLYYRQKFNCLRKSFIRTYFSNPKSTIADNEFYPTLIIKILANKLDE